MNREKIEALWYAVRPVIIYSILFISVQAVLYRLVESVLIALRADMTAYYANWSQPAEMLILALSVAAGLMPVFREGQREVARVEAHRGSSAAAKNSQEKYLLIILSLGTACLCLAINLLTGFVTRNFAVPTGVTTVSEMQPAFLPLSAAVYGILTPFAEELIYRGLMYARLRESMPVRESILLSASLFGLSHGNLRQGIYAFVMGALFAYSYEFTREFSVPFILHCMCNLLVLFLEYFHVYDNLASPFWLVLFLLTAALCADYWRKNI